ncbi:MAG: Dabb family protein, partial [Verrucomicrobiota bacterium]
MSIRQIVILFIALALPAVAESDAKEINHVVICWYDEAVSDETIDQAIKAVQGFKQIEGVEDVRVGRAIPSDRAIVDDSFSIGVFIRTKDAESLERYIEHPIHKMFVKKFVSGKTTKVTVY